MAERTFSSQITNRAFLVRPKNFRSNVETLQTCGFQDSSLTVTTDHHDDDGTHYQDESVKVSLAAIEEFDKLSKMLQSCGINVTEESDRQDLELPDSVFPNNWISFHSNDTSTSPAISASKPSSIVLYPMLSKIRRLERQDSIIHKWQEELNADIFDLTHHEKEGMFLEGTGSMVLDRAHRLAYACISPRTNASLLKMFCEKMNYQPVVFNATHKSTDGATIDIYHTNVMMSIAEKFALVCLDSIRDEAERKMVVESFEKTGKAIIPITEHQMTNFAGNALQLFGRDNQRFYFMSTKAFQALDDWQKAEISKSSEICHTSIDVIEKHGGGGVRCMIAEIFPPV